MPERMTAKKIRTADLVNGEWVQQDGMEPSYVVTKAGEKVSRARILATVVSKFVSEDGNFGSVTIDDGTDTARVKCFKDLTPIEKAENGMLVDVIGKVREYNGEIYMIPEIMKHVKDPNFMLLRKLELAGKKVQPAEALEQKPGKIKAEASEQDALRKIILQMIGSSNEGIEYTKLIEKSGQTEDRVDAVINDLLSEGICYEPTPGKIRKI